MNGRLPPAHGPLPIRVILAQDAAGRRAPLRAELASDARIRIVGEAGERAALLRLIDGVPCDAVLLDLDLPGRTGFEVLRHLAGRRNPPAPVVISVHDDPGIVDQALALGALGYLLESAPTADVVFALEQAVAGGAYLQPVLARAVLQRHLQLAAVGPRARIDLSRRQVELLRALASGLSNKEIAHLLDLALGTVNDYMKQLYARLGVDCRAEAVAVGIRRGLIA
jgi:DNA-binding NarL/FixJ family response regulator